MHSTQDKSARLERTHIESDYPFLPCGLLLPGFLRVMDTPDISHTPNRPRSPLTYTLLPRKGGSLDLTENIIFIGGNSLVMQYCDAN